MEGWLIFIRCFVRPHKPLKNADVHREEHRMENQQIIESIRGRILQALFELLIDSSEMFNMRVAAYCLMPGHYHILNSNS